MKYLFVPGNYETYNINFAWTRYTYHHTHELFTKSRTITFSTGVRPITGKIKYTVSTEIKKKFDSSLRQLTNYIRFTIDILGIRDNISFDYICLLKFRGHADNKIMMFDNIILV